MRNPVISEKIKYIREVFAPEDDLLCEIRKNLQEGELQMQIGAEEGKLLQFLVTISGAEKIVEVGTLAGYSAIWMARGLPQKGHLFALEKDPRRAKSARGNFDKSGVGDKITVMEGEAKESLKKIEKDGPFDMVFIDADKAGYPHYLDWAEKNVRKGGLIVGDNTFLFDTVHLDNLPKDSDIGNAAHKAMKEFNSRLASPKKYQSILLPTEEGMTVAKKLF